MLLLNVTLVYQNPVFSKLNSYVSLREFQIIKSSAVLLFIVICHIVSFKETTLPQYVLTICKTEVTCTLFLSTLQLYNRQLRFCNITFYFMLTIILFQTHYHILKSIFNKNFTHANTHTHTHTHMHTHTCTNIQSCACVRTLTNWLLPMEFSSFESRICRM